MNILDHFLIKILELAENDIRKAKDINDLNKVRSNYLGKKGIISNIYKVIFK